MKIEVVEAKREDEPVMRNLMQLYQYDFSEIYGPESNEYDVNAHGLYDEFYLDLYWIEPGRYPFLVKVDGHWAGLALVRRHSVLGRDEAETFDMAEFFVMRKYRRRGIGQYVARWLFDRFAGRWEVAEVAPNTAAQAFWRRVIGEYTGGRYEEYILDDERWQGPIQVFYSRK